jgi:hypothetical protein
MDNDCIAFIQVSNENHGNWVRCEMRARESSLLRTIQTGYEALFQLKPRTVSLGGNRPVIVKVKIIGDIPIHKVCSLLHTH